MRIEHLNFYYDLQRPIFEDISLEFKSNAITTIIGPNGSGKSTLLQLLSHNLKPKSGQIFLQDKLLNQYSQKALAQRLATVHQKSKVPEDFTVRQVIETGRYSYQRLFKKDLRKDSVVNTVIQQLDLTQFEHQSVMNLSGGELQRVFIGMALAQEPQYLLLDEPTTFLDIHYQYQVLDIIKWLHEEYQMTIIMVLHDINQAIEYSDELICLGNKGLLAQGRPKDIIDHTLIQDMYHIDAKILQDPDCGTVIGKKRGGHNK